MRKIICFFKGHKRGYTKYGDGEWQIGCLRCGYGIEYKSPFVRLVGIEMRFGFDGE